MLNLSERINAVKIEHGGKGFHHCWRHIQTVSHFTASCNYRDFLDTEFRARESGVFGDDLKAESEARRHDCRESADFEIDAFHPCIFHALGY